MLRAFLKDLGISSAFCLGERVLERVLLPGFHCMGERVASADPKRVDDLSTLIAEALGLLALVWLFIVSLYAISLLSRRPLKPHATTMVAAAIVLLIFVGSWAQWSTLSAPPQ
jgi:hypothetical protein